MNWKNLMQGVGEDFERALGEKLTGIYVHGSIAFGCFRWETSDVDFLAVVKNPLTQPEKIKLAEILLRHTPSAPAKGIEMSVVTEHACRNFTYPTPFEFHFSNAYLSDYQRDPAACCEKLCGTDPDLAGHFSVVKARGITWSGKPIREVFGNVPRSALLKSICSDAEDASGNGVFENPTYFTLNLCRVIACVEQNLLLSKKEGGEWALSQLPETFHPTIRSALNAYANDTPVNPSGLAEFRDYALERIRQGSREMNS